MLKYCQYCNVFNDNDNNNNYDNNNENDSVNNNNNNDINCLQFLNVNTAAYWDEL